MNTKTTVADVQVESHGSIVLFRPLTGAARAWTNAHIGPDAQWFGGGLCVEPRYAQGLIVGMEEDGLKVAIPQAN